MSYMRCLNSFRGKFFQKSKFKFILLLILNFKSIKSIHFGFAHSSSMVRKEETSKW